MEERAPDPNRRLYSEEDVKGILEKALLVEGRSDFTRTDLEQMAKQLGISEEQLARAEREWFHAPVEDMASLRQEFTQQRRHKHLGKLAGVGATLLFLGVLIFLKTPLTGIAIAFFFITFFTAYGTLQESVEALFATGGEEFERDFDAWLEQRDNRYLEQQKRRKLLSE